MSNTVGKTWQWEAEITRVKKEIGKLIRAEHRTVEHNEIINQRQDRGGRQDLKQRQ